MSPYSFFSVLLVKLNGRNRHDRMTGDQEAGGNAASHKAETDDGDGNVLGLLFRLFFLFHVELAISNWPLAKPGICKIPA
jgi:hypothetical protein